MICHEPILGWLDPPSLIQVCRTSKQNHALVSAYMQSLPYWRSLAIMALNHMKAEFTTKHKICWARHPGGVEHDWTTFLNEVLNKVFATKGANQNVPHWFTAKDADQSVPRSLSPLDWVTPEVRRFLHTTLASSFSTLPLKVFVKKACGHSRKKYQPFSLEACSGSYFNSGCFNVYCLCLNMILGDNSLKYSN